MGRAVALLRGINVGGRNGVAMADLRAIFEDLGHRRIETYLQSGNVVFEATGAPASLPGTIRRRITNDLGLDVPVAVRTGADLQKIFTTNPFLADGADPTTLHVVFAVGRAASGALGDLAPERFSPDRFAHRGREIYLQCPNGYGRTKLTNAFFESRLGPAAGATTTRNWNTVTRLAELSKD
jgi:uncharacterized protein (DUF1697 family)